MLNKNKTQIANFNRYCRFLNHIVRTTIITTISHIMCCCIPSGLLAAYNHFNSAYALLPHTY